MREDRRVHATTRFAELVRYNRAGKWYVEDDVLGRSRVTLEMAARIARYWEASGGTIHFGVPGGRRFDARVKEGQGCRVSPVPYPGGERR